MKIETAKAIIVEDNHEAAMLLEKYLRNFPEIHLVALAKTVDEATLAFLKHRPSLVFLDVELDNKSGFEFLENIRGISPELAVIFTTAFDHYAVEAIKYSAFDYLLKPIDPKELEISINKFRSKPSSQDFDMHLDTLKSSLTRYNHLKLKKKHGFIVVNAQDIIYGQADWNYTEIFLTDGKSHIITMNIGQLEKELPTSDFVRANRSQILNIHFIQQVDKEEKVCMLKAGNIEIALSMSDKKIRKLESILDRRVGEKKGRG